MSDALVILLTTLFVNNFVLVQFLGLCPFMGTSKKLESALGMATATTFVLTLGSALSFLVNEYLLVPLQLEFLRILAFIFIIAVVVQFTEILMRKTQPMLHQVLGLFIPLITTNCAVLGVALLNIRHANNFIESVMFGLGAALGFSLVLILFAGIREQMETADIPEPFKGSAIGMITAGIMSLAFMGFTGMS
jgi:electron transport complex protein RnfA